MASHIAPCLADESGAPVCPDLHQHETVLRDGQQFLDRSKRSDPSNKSSDSYGPRGFGIGFAEFGPIIFNDWGRSFDEPGMAAKFKARISNLQFDSEEALSTAQYNAQVCLFLGQFPEGYGIEKQILDAYDSGKVQATPDNLARTLRTAIECRVLSGCEKTDQLKRFSSEEMLYHIYTAHESTPQPQRYREIAYLNLVHQIESSRSANPAWSEALELSKRLAQLHPKLASETDLSCLIALLFEWNNQIAEARDTLSSAAVISPSELFKTTCIGFCQRHDDLTLLKQLDPLIIPKPPWVTVSTYELNKLRSNDPSPMFHTLISDYRGESKPALEVRLHAICDVIKYLNDLDEPALKEFLVTNLESNDLLDEKWIARILSESANKWKNFPLEAYLAYVHQVLNQTPSALRQFALYFASTGDYETSLKAQNAIFISVNRITKDWNNMDQRLTLLTQVKSDLSAPWVMQSEQGKTLRKDVELALAGLVVEHEKRECLDVAAKLDATANQLEDRYLFAKAADMHRESLNIKTKNLGPNNPEVLSSLNGLARTLSVQKKYKEADAAYRNALAFYNANKQFRDRDYASMLESYAQMLASSGQKAKADKVYEDARTFYRQMDTAHY
jgi:tetratricopeptide (TPR) repeat protein